MENNKQQSLNQEVPSDLNSELTIIGLIFTILIMFSCYIHDKVTLQKQLATTQEQLLQAKTIAVALDQELSSSYVMIESLNKELDKYELADSLVSETVRINKREYRAK